MASKIVSVDAGSPAARAGLKAGETLLQIDGVAIRDVLDYKFYSYDAARTLQVMEPDGETLREVALFDAGGRWLTTVAASADQCTIDVSYLPAGVYACRITTATGRTELGKFAVR